MPKTGKSCHCRIIFNTQFLSQSHEPLAYMRLRLIQEFDFFMCVRLTVRIYSIRKHEKKFKLKMAVQIV